MLVNLNVKIKAGLRTPVEVTVYGTSVNEKIIKFQNGKKVSENDIADWIGKELGKALEKIQNET